MRGGTENLIGIMGLATAFDLAMADLEEHARHIRALKQEMVAGLASSVPGIPSMRADGPGGLPLHCPERQFPEHEKNGMLLFLLDLEGVACSGGSACSSGSTQPSHVLSALGLHEEGRTSIRFSFSRLTTSKCIHHASRRWPHSPGRRSGLRGH